MSIEKVEVDLNHSDYACTGAVLLDLETGKTIASFWHYHEAIEVVKKINTHDKHVARISELEDMLRKLVCRGCDFYDLDESDANLDLDDAESIREHFGDELCIAKKLLEQSK